MITLIVLASLLRAHAAQPFDCPAALENFVTRAQPQAARLRVEINRSIGLSWRAAVAHRPYTNLDPKKIAEDAASPEFATTGQIAEPFGARTMAFPVAHMNRLLDEWSGIGEDARIFALYLTPAEIDAQFDGELPQNRRPQLVEAFAYLRYYVRGDRFIVTEVQSDVYRALPEGQRDRYRAWDNVLLLSFEKFVDTIRKDQPWTIVVAGEDYQKRRQKRIKDRVARTHYRNLPAWLGYHGTFAHERLEWDGTKGVSQLEQVGPALAMTSSVTRASTNLQRTQAYERIKFSLKDRSVLARAEMNKVTPRAAGLTSVVAPGGFAAPTPYNAFPNELLYENEEQKKAHERALNAIPPWTRDLEEVSLVSLARAGADEIALGEIEVGGHRVMYEHWPLQERHAAISLVDHPGSVTIKGVGRRSLLERSDLPPQVFAARSTPIVGHQVWGGDTESQGLFEVQNHLSVLELGRRANLTPWIAIPLDVGWIEQWPRVDGDKRTLVNADAYTAKELADAPERLVQARFFARAGTRVSAIGHALTRGTSEEISKWLGPLLVQTYAAFEVPFRMPEMGELNPKNAAEIGNFLDHVKQFNGDRAEQILRTWAERSLSTMGLVHGAGGHLGGTRVEFPAEIDRSRKHALPTGFGAPGGGATHKRNISLAGELRDLDEDVYLPEHPSLVYAENPEATEDAVPGMQREDLRHWMEAYYWMRILLLGETDIPADVAFEENLFTEGGFAPNFLGSERQQEFAHREYRRAQSIRFEDPNEVHFKDSHLDDVYKSAREAGRKSGEDRAE